MAVTGTGEDSLRTAEADFIVAVWGGGGVQAVEEYKVHVQKSSNGC